MKVSEISAILGTWVGISSAILGGYLALHSYQADVATRAAAEHKRIDERVEAAFRMVEEFHQPAFVTMRSRFVQSFDTRADCRDFAPPSTISVQEVFTLVEYFDRVDLCVKDGLCDKATIQQLLSPYANSWWPYLKSQVEMTRAREATLPGQGYGTGVRELAIASVAAPACPVRTTKPKKPDPRVMPP